MPVPSADTSSALVPDAGAYGRIHAYPRGNIRDRDNQASAVGGEAGLRAQDRRIDVAALRVVHRSHLAGILTRRQFGLKGCGEAFSEGHWLNGLSRPAPARRPPPRSAWRDEMRRSADRSVKGAGAEIESVACTLAYLPR